ncbi:heme ABC transporter ATP-binding protein [Arenicella sp. 4NH20-0111]|uniref:heme ABC transporter ATP-binding protein n=1 Tax=Arenicella sp. 4NH20-0111 TaxID=3127648 RepID=UPI003103C8E4
MKPVLIVKDLTVPVPSNGSHNLVSNCSFSIERGEILAIIGPNGAGKSSLIKAIEGSLKYKGTIDMPTISHLPKLRAKQLSVLPQQSALNFPFTVEEVVELGRIPHSTGKQRDIEIIRDALSMMDISYLSNRRYTELSGGEKQRVQLARVFCQIWEPDDQNQQRLLILDEPTSALDLGHQHHLMSAIKTFSNRGVAVIMVSHDINLATRYADSLLAMMCSEQLAYGTPKEVVTKSNMQRLFGLQVEILVSHESGQPVLIGA